MSHAKILLITGVSSGLGRALAREAIRVGHRVVGTVRSEQAREQFEALDPVNAISRVLDVTHFDDIDGMVSEVETTIGPIDVLVNAVIASDAPPAHLLLGSDALMLVRDKLSALADQIRLWESVTRSTDG